MGVGWVEIGWVSFELDGVGWVWLRRLAWVG